MVVIIVAGLLLFFLIRFFRKHSYPAMNCVCLVTGGVKVGKSTFCVWKCVTEHFWRYVKVKIYNFFHRKNLRELPYLYSNIPLKYFGYRRFTEDILLRKKRLPYGSICYLNEASLVADSMLYKNQQINEDLMLFVKLYGHATYGGMLLFDTQSVGDLHFAIKRCISEYVYIDGNKKRLFGCLFSYRRMKFSDVDGSSIDVNIFDGKEEERSSVWVPKLTWRIFDAFCYSAFTDYLPVSCEKSNSKSLKADTLLTLSDSRKAITNKNIAESKNGDIAIKDIKDIFKGE